MSQSPASETEPSPPAPVRVWKWRAALGACIGVFLVRALMSRVEPFEQIDWTLENANELMAWLRGLVWRELVLFGLSFVLGALTPPALGAVLGEGDRPGGWRGRLATWAFGLATIALCFALAWDELPPAGSLLLPFVSFLVGAELGWAMVRGGRALAWAAGSLAAAALLLAIAARVALGLVVAAAPLSFDAPTMSAEAKRQLTDLLRETRPEPGQARHLRLNDTEINALVNAALSRGGDQRKARWHFEPSGFAVEASLEMPRWGGRFLNVTAGGEVSIEAGDLHLAIDRLRLGSLSVPSWIAQLLAAALHAMLMDEPQVRRIVDSVEALQAQAAAVDVVFQPDSLSRQVVPALAHLLWRRPDVAFETEVYLRALMAVDDRSASKEERFALLVQSAFALAAARSAGHDARLENRAAIFALAILLGHPGLEPFVGELLDADARAQAETMIDSVTLRGRGDSPRHFLVSAALALLLDEATSDRIGVLKEQLDSGDGGSGFSFPDLLADLAGTRFAAAATRDERSARAVQTALTRRFSIDAICPPFDGLPEDIPAAEFESRYGGVNGAGYRARMEQIHRRLEAMPPL